MKLYLEKGELALPEGFSFEITHNNPFFSTEGSASAPVTLPPVPLNFEILSHPEDTHRLNRVIKNYDVQLQAGLFFSKCKLVVDGASRKGGISASLALKESVMYAELQDRKLPELFAGQFENASASRWDIYHTDRTDIFGDPDPIAAKICYFPVACDQRTVGTGNSERVVVSIINEPGTSDFNTASRSWVINGGSVTMPQYYGLAPFMYLWALIEDAFKLCGYKVIRNVFKTSSPLKDIVVLHNTIDSEVSRGGMALSGSNIRYEQIVPDITMGDLIGWLRDKFGAIVAAENGEVTITLFNDTVGKAYDLDLSSFIREDVQVTHPDPKRLEIEMETGIDSAAPAAEDLESLIANYRTRAFVNKVADITGTGLFYVEPLGKYYFKKTSDAAPVMVGTDAFRYARNVKDIEAEVLKTDDTFVPMIEYNGRIMPYIGSSVRRWIERAGDCDEGFSQPLMICYALEHSRLGDNAHYCGSTNCFNEDGFDEQGYPSLTPEELFSTYWERYQKLIVNACPELSCSLDIPIDVLLSIDITTPKRLNGDLVLIKELRFTLGDNGVSSCEATFLQIAEYQDAVQLPDIRINNPSLHWKLVNTRSIFAYGNTKDGISIDETDGLTDYTMSDAPAALPDRAGVVAKRRTRWLRYTKYTSYRKFLSWGSSSYRSVHNYEEYFISTFNG